MAQPARDPDDRQVSRRAAGHATALPQPSVRLAGGRCAPVAADPMTGEGTEVLPIGGRRARVLVAHNRYQIRGGEDSVVETEVDMLRRRGHDVLVYSRSNDEIEVSSRLGVMGDLMWSRTTDSDIRARILAFKPDVVHCHNTFPLISPAIYWAAQELGVPVIQTLHNFRLVCPQALLLREGKPCEDCVGKVPWRAVVHRCYRDSALQSGAVATMIEFHRRLGTWQRKVDLYIALNDFCRDLFVKGGLPAHKVRVRPNCLDVASLPARERRGFLFVGRLSSEKGVDVLCRALDELRLDEPVTVCGTGPMAEQVRQHPRIRYLAAQDQSQVIDLMSRSRALLLPSVWYENFPRVVVEAFACSLPVIASRIGSLPGIVEDGRTGLLFAPGDATALADAMRQAQDCPQMLASMGDAARETYERDLTVEKGYRSLVDLYAEAIHARRNGVQPVIEQLA
jgi:glycosyltransferase involved in cell wall biosynthesis